MAYNSQQEIKTTNNSKRLNKQFKKTKQSIQKKEFKSKCIQFQLLYKYMYTVEPSEINIKKNNLSLISVSDFLACPTSPKPEILEDRETSTLSLFFQLQFP